jgi:hypothetical protein
LGFNIDCFPEPGKGFTAAASQGQPSAAAGFSLLPGHRFFFAIRFNMNNLGGTHQFTVKTIPAIVPIGNMGQSILFANYDHMARAKLRADATFNTTGVINAFNHQNNLLCKQLLCK